MCVFKPKGLTYSLPKDPAERLTGQDKARDNTIKDFFS